MGAGGAAGRGEQAGVQHGGVDPAGVALLGQPVAQPCGREPVGPVLGVEAGQERQADRGVEVGEQADGAGEDVAQVGAQLVGRGDAVLDQVLAGPAGAAQRDGGVGVGDQRAQPGPVGAQGVGQHVGVEPVVLVAGRAVAAAQVLDLVRGDHHHGQAGGQQGVDDGAVGSFDGDLADAVPAQEGDQVAQAGGGVLDHRGRDLAAAAVDDARGVVVTGPVDPRGHVVAWYLGQCVVRVLLADFTSASSLLSPVGRHPPSVDVQVSLVPGRGCRFAH